MSQSHGFVPYGRGVARGPIGEQLLHREPRSQEQIAAEIAAKHPVAEVVAVDFSQQQEAVTAVEQAM